MKPHSEFEQKAFGVARAQQMRESMTRAEAKLWAILEPMGFQAQTPIQVSRKQAAAGKKLYIMDFYHPAARVCVEVDGSVHRRRTTSDRRRDTALRMNGIVTFRVTNSQVLSKAPLVNTISLIVALLRGGESGGEKEETSTGDGGRPGARPAAEPRS